jgi:hypothetical protein
MIVFNNNRSKVITTIAGLVVIVTISFGQGQNQTLTSTPQQIGQKDVIPPSPEVQAFAKYGNVPVSFYTGIPQVSVPIYEIKARDISVPISLSYHAGGIKVSEEASRVGLGWVLNAGGMISRNVINRDDFDDYGGGFLDATRNPAWILREDSVYIHIADPVQEGTDAAFINRVSEVDRDVLDLEEAIDGINPLDFEPDQFNYNFNGNSGKFIVRQRQDHSLETILEKKEKVFILPTRNGSTWTVKTADGTKYIFDVKETYQRYGYNGDGETTSAWYLSSITSPLGEQVFFDYEVASTYASSSIGTFFERRQAASPPAAECLSGACDAAQGITPAPQPVVGPQVYKMAYLTSIRWSNGKIIFEMGSRIDVDGDKRLERISIYSKDPLTGDNVIKETHEFGYDYFYTTAPSPGLTGGVSSTLANNRLKLVSVSRKPANGIAAVKEYQTKFEYYEDGLPSKTSYSRDHWGFFNGKGLTSLIPTYTIISQPITLRDFEGIMGSERNASISPATGGTLKKIIYPTGGYTQFTFEGNTYDIAGSAAPVGAYSDSQPFDVTRTFGSQLPVDVSGTIDLHDEYESDPATHSTAEATIHVTFQLKTNPLNTDGQNPSGCQPTNASQYIVEITDWNNLLIKTVTASANSNCTPGSLDCLSCQQQGIITIAVGTVMKRGIYNIRVRMPGLVTDAFHIYQASAIHVKVDYLVDPLIRSSTAAPNDDFAYAGGLRINKIVDYDPESDRHYNTRMYDYHYKNASNEIHSHGKLLVRPSYTFNETGFTRVSSNGGYCLDCVYIIRQSDSFLPATGSLGSPVGYSAVTEYQGEKGTDNTAANGRIDYVFNNDLEYVMTYKHPFNANYLMKPPAVSTIGEVTNGTLISKTERDLNRNIKRVTRYNYTYKWRRYDYGIEVRQVNMSNMTSVPDQNLVDYFRKSKAWFNLYLYPAISSSFLMNQSVTETTYLVNGQVLTTTNYFYDNPDHLQPTRTTTVSSNNHTIETTTRYPHDYAEVADTHGDPVYEMRTSLWHMPGVPIETKVVDVTAGKVLSNNVTMFQTFNSAFSYMPTGKFLLPIRQLALRIAPDVNGYSAYSPASGSHYSTAFFRSAKFDYNDKGNLTLVQKDSDMPVSYVWGNRNSFPTAQVTNALAENVFIQTFEEIPTSSLLAKPHTGQNYKPGTYPVNFPTPSVPYYLEYWSLDTYGKWNHKKMNYSGPTTINDGVGVDDVRVYPKDALVKSFTYDPFGEMTSSVSESGYTLIYDHDTFSRLKTVRNERGEIIKNYTYHYKQSD